MVLLVDHAQVCIQQASLRSLGFRNANVKIWSRRPKTKGQAALRVFARALVFFWHCQNEILWLLSGRPVEPNARVVNLVTRLVVESSGDAAERGRAGRAVAHSATAEAVKPSWATGWLRPLEDNTYDATAAAFIEARFGCLLLANRVSIIKSLLVLSGNCLVQSSAQRSEYEECRTTSSSSRSVRALCSQGCRHFSALLLAARQAVRVEPLLLAWFGKRTWRLMVWNKVSGLCASRLRPARMATIVLAKLIDCTSFAGSEVSPRPVCWSASICISTWL
jgi:hypothetical protein